MQMKGICTKLLFLCSAPELSEVLARMGMRCLASELAQKHGK